MKIMSESKKMNSFYLLEMNKFAMVAEKNTTTGFSTQNGWSLLPFP